jgi:hypothetical protein
VLWQGGKGKEAIGYWGHAFLHLAQGLHFGRVALGHVLSLDVVDIAPRIRSNSSVPRPVPPALTALPPAPPCY